MPKIEKPGTYVLSVKEADWGESNNGTPFISLWCESEAGQHISAYLYFSEKSMEGSLEVGEKVFGLDSDAENWPIKMVGKQFSGVVEEDTYEGKTRMRVKYLNPLRKPPKEVSNQRQLFAKLNALAKAKGMKAAPSPRPPARSAPQATKVDDDDVPF